MLSRQQFLRGLVALGVSAASIELWLGAEQAPPALASAPPRYLVLIVLDAFRPDYMQLAPMPALQSLISAGTSYDRAWVAQLESETPVGHATISTGSLPRNDGVIGFEWRDPKTQQEVLDGWPPGVIAGKLERDLHASGVGSIPQAVKSANRNARVVALSSEKVYAASALGGWAADYVLYHQRTGTNNVVLTPQALPGHKPPADFFARPNLREGMPLQHFTDWDYLSTMLALDAFDAFHPDVLMVNLPGADVYGHPFGPAVPSIMAQVAAGLDRNIARIIAAYKKSGIYDQTLFVVTADHGMVPNDRAVAGPDTKTIVQGAGGQYLFHTGGTAADIYLHNYWHARAVATDMLRLPNVAAAYYQMRPHGHYEYVPVPGMQIDPALDAAYQYLLSTFVGPTAPDVVAPFRENTIGARLTTAHGDHGGLNWGAQHVPLILSGPGVRSRTVSHYPARLVDVAPTVLRILGVPAGPMDGTVLADALTGATAAEVAAQTALAAPLTGYQDALIAQSEADIAEDVRTKVLPPPPSRIQRP